MSELLTLAQRARLRRRAAADAADFARAKGAFAAELPDAVRELWSLSDGMDGDGIELLSLAAAVEYAEIFADGFGYFPVADCHQSNPYTVCLRGPLRGAVVQVFHDDESRLICSGLARFFELVAAARASGNVARLTGDYAVDHPDRTPTNAETARELMRAAEGMDRLDDERRNALQFAAHLFGAGHEDELADVLALGDEYTRRAVQRRWTGLGTPEAQNHLRADAREYRTFLATLKKAFEAAGLRTEPTQSGEFRLQPGNVGINFAMLFADCRRPRAMDEWVQRFRDRLAGT